MGIIPTKMPTREKTIDSITPEAPPEVCWKMATTVRVTNTSQEIMIRVHFVTRDIYYSLYI
jgi:hypothetical protein